MCVAVPENARLRANVGDHAMSESEAERAERERKNREREEELKRVPLQTIDKSRWPKDVRPIAMPEADGLGVDRDGRLYWDGRPVEIIGRRLDLTWTQGIVAIVVAILTLVIAAATVVQAAVAYHDWACRTGWRPVVACAAVRR
jgi:hypothetical protein